MKISIDISMYPLQDAYCQPILDFIERVEQLPNINIQRNSLSTQIFGEYRPVMDTLDSEIQHVLEKIPETVFVIKLIGMDRNKANIHAC
ncbi:hypothetical protein MNBD_GAMMA04-1775 [hydrothermal vent metagenome]|uniref:Thiamin/hydroxymethyl pyrimidine-binding YkoF putative domain-containing protein n=1 Tax=hydrothermal vent metagenome TaxID=652676 RepID=A0A3B0W2N2_9ZZZZ